MKKIIILLMLFVIALVVVGCGSEDVQDNTNVVLTPAQMQHGQFRFHVGARGIGLYFECS